MPELLAPAGNFQKLKFALHYGADAVYLGAKSFSLREGADNFTTEELAQAVDYAHAHNRKVFLTLNIFYHNRHVKELIPFLEEIAPIPVDGYILSDVGLIDRVRNDYPHKAVHVSTQANTTNAETVKFYERMGVKRVILARELTLNEIREIREQTDVELETFIHGAMCIAYSGRCLLSNYLTNRSVYSGDQSTGNRRDLSTRDANLGDCSQSCRWNFQLLEMNRPDEPLPMVEDPSGTTQILSSKDLNLGRQMKELISAGINSFKIEGRMKSLYYAANVTRAYRHIIDAVTAGTIPDEEWYAELDTVSHREYTTGFYFAENRAMGEATTNGAVASNTTALSYLRDYTFVAYVQENGDGILRAANQIKTGQTLEWVRADGKTQIIRDFELLKNGVKVDVVNPNDDFYLRCEHSLKPFDILRREKTE